MNCATRVAICLAVVATAIAAPARGNLIVNGGFETGDFTGWTHSNQALVDSSGGFSGYAPHSGSFFAALGTVGSVGNLSQTFADTAGQTLQISLWLASNGTTPNEFDIEFNGVTLFDQINIPTQPYTNITETVLATGSDTLTISERDDPDWLALDDVSVVPVGVPEPASLAIFSTALVGLGLIRRRRRQARPMA